MMITSTEYLLPPLEEIVDRYLGLLVFSEKITVLDNKWDVKYRDGLQGVFAFTKWTIPQKEAFNGCHKLTFILGVSPTLGPDMSYMFHGASSFNQPLQSWDTSLVTDMSYMFHGAWSWLNTYALWATPRIRSQ